MSKAQQDRINILTPLIKAIKKKCLDCCAGNSHEVKHCVCYDCNLFPYRLGLNEISEKSPPKKSKTTESEAIRECGG